MVTPRSITSCCFTYCTRTLGPLVVAAVCVTTCYLGNAVANRVTYIHPISRDLALRAVSWGHVFLTQRTKQNTCPLRAWSQGSPTSHHTQSEMRYSIRVVKNNWFFICTIAFLIVDLAGLTAYTIHLSVLVSSGTSERYLGTVVNLTRSQGLQKQRMSSLSIDIYCLAAGSHRTSHAGATITWQGIPRQIEITRFQTLILGPLWSFLYNSFFRRVINQVWNRRSSSSGKWHPQTTNVVYVRPPPDAKIADGTANVSSSELYLTVNVSRVYQLKQYGLIGGKSYQRIEVFPELSVAPCDHNGSFTPSSSLGEGELFHIYTCPGVAASPRDYTYNWPVQWDSEKPIGFEYTIGRYPWSEWPPTPAPNRSTHNWLDDQVPSLWIEDPYIIDEDRFMTPYLSHPILPSVGWHTVSKTYRTYKVVPYCEPEMIRREPMGTNLTNSSPNAMVIATGMVYEPEFLKASEQVSFIYLKGDRPGLYNLCKITEEYRTTSSAKLITPFGLAGKLATRAFRERLQQQYHRRAEPQDSTKTTQESGTEESGSRVEIDMTRFLLDYVIDMGPASLPSPPQEKQDSETDGSDSEDYEDEVSYQRVRGLGKEDGVEATKLEWESGTIEPVKSRIVERGFVWGRVHTRDLMYAYRITIKCTTVIQEYWNPWNLGTVVFPYDYTEWNVYASLGVRKSGVKNYMLMNDELEEREEPIHECNEEVASLVSLIKFKG
ncbi:hypothetical protein AG1IA_08695 [Rhizoctonia solani AG-1 IA]|uniref:Uncharacterized protein n=1 Tax=Thanatephorus cucumeris (strain AG1-IA) TaxID=983506 RepID=L8WH96_THACA|nr:hypothetical protein AG1IA_08695 [Rhizoctonia solani AG-1 IA]